MSRTFFGEEVPVTLAILLNPSFAFLEYLIAIAIIYEEIIREY
jgi:hypothetical protein